MTINRLGQIAGAHRVLRLIDQGGMSAVYGCLASDYRAVQWLRVIR